MQDRTANRWLTLSLAALLVVALTAGCGGGGDETPAEKMGDAADEVGDNVSDAAEEAGDAVEEAAEETGDAIEEGTDEMKEEM